MTLRRIALTMIVVAAFFIALGIVLDFLVDWLWFSTLGYLSVFLISFVAKASLFLVVFATSALILWLNGTLAHRLVKRSGTLPLAFGPWGSAGHQSLAVLLKHPPSQIPWRFLISGRLAYPRSSYCPGRDWIVGYCPLLSLAGAIWTGRSPLREGYRILPLFASRLRCD